MANLLIRSLESETIKRLKLRAKKHHRSLQGELKYIVEIATKLSMEETKKLSKQWHKRLSNYNLSNSTTQLREDRNR